MFKPTILNIFLFWLLKYFVFYIFLMFKNNYYALVMIYEIKNGEDLFYYLWLILFFPISFMMLFIIPLIYTFKIKNIFLFLLLIVIFLIFEYIIYTKLASTTDLMNGVYNGIISVIFLFLFFYKHIIKQFQFKNY